MRFFPRNQFFFLPKNSISKFTPHSQTLSLFLSPYTAKNWLHFVPPSHWISTPPFHFFTPNFFWHTNACVGSFLSFVNATNCYFRVFKRVTLTSVLALQRWTKTISIGRRFRLCVPNSPSSRTHIIVVTDAVAIIFFCSHWLTKCPLSLQASRRQGQGEGEKEEGTLLGKHKNSRSHTHTHTYIYTDTRQTHTLLSVNLAFLSLALPPL